MGMLRRSTQLTCTLPRLAASVCMAVSSAAPTTTLESMTARCAAPTDTRFGPVRADGDTATAASSTSCTRRPSTMLRRSTQLTCTLPRLAASVCIRQLRSANHYARKYDRQVRRANRHAFRASKGGWGHSYRGQQHQLHKAAKHAAKAQYAANMYAAKTGGLGVYGRQLRSANHYARKYDRQVRRANRHAFRASKGGWGHS